MPRHHRKTRIPVRPIGIALCAMATGTASATVPMIRNLYEVTPSGFAGHQASLTSTASCATNGEECSIENSIVVPAVDRYVTVEWRDRNGTAMVRTSNYSYVGAVFGPTNYTKQRQDASSVTTHGRFMGLNVTPFTGTADFTGTGSGSDPCGVGYVCDDARYYEFTTGGKSALPPVPPPGASALLGSFTTTFEYVAVDPDTREPFEDTRFAYFEFASEVTADAAGYHYRHTATNHAAFDQPFTWDAVGLSGLLGAGASQSVEWISPAAPALVSAVATVRLARTEPIPLTEEFRGATIVLQPVPEPATGALCIAGLVLLGGWRARAAARIPPH